jgi:DNA anti-recombination protein RmuC
MTMRPGRYICVATLMLALAAAPAAAQDADDDARDAADRTHAELDKFQTWIGEQIDAVEQEIGELKQELEDSEPAARDRIDQMIRQAEQLAGDLREQARRASEASAEQWEGAKASALSGWHRVRAAYYAALAELRGEGEEND